MNKSGTELIRLLCQKLQGDGKACTDSEILGLLRSLDRYELNQLLTFGTVAKWEREKTNKHEQE